METNNQKNDQNIIPNDADKQQKGVNVPNLRFPNFSKNWNKSELKTFANRINRRNVNNESSLPLTISAQFGLINQNDFFNKQIASRDLSNYILIKNGEFAYNKSYSADYPWGAIKRLDLYEKGVLSSLYICFSLSDNVVSDYFVHYFESSKWHKQISDIAGEGARNHGLLNMSVSDFFETGHKYPTKEEQTKISNFLNLINERILTQSKIIEDLELFKNRISYQIFFELNGENIVSLGEIASIYQPETISQFDFKNDGPFNVYGANGIIGKYDKYNHEESEILLSCRGNCGTINMSMPKSWINGNAMVIHVKTANINKKFMYYYLQNINFKALISGSGVPQITRKPVENIKVKIPFKDKQIFITNIMDCIYLKIKKEKDILELYKKQKAYLLKNMFI